MKRTLKVGFVVLLVFVLFGSLSCQSWCKRWQAEDRTLSAEGGGGPQHPEGIPAARGAAVVPSVAAPAPVWRPAADRNIQGSAAVRPPVDMVTAVKPRAEVAAEHNSNVVSRIYPCAECGIIRVDKALPEQIEPNQPFSYSIRFANLTDMAINGVVITEEIPDDFKLISSNPTARTQPNKLVWEIDLLEPRARKEITISGVATNGGFPKYCTTVVTQVIPACASVRVIQPKLEVMRASPTEALICDPISVRFGVANSGTGAVEGVKLVDVLPAGLQTLDGKSEMVFDVGALAPGQSRQFSAELRATKTGKYVCQAVASSLAGLRAESPAMTLVVGRPVLTISQTVPEKHYLGRALTYDITVANKGDGAAKRAVIENIIPAGARGLRASGGAKLSGSKLVWHLGTFAAGASRKLRVSYTPTKGGMLTSGIIARAYCMQDVTALAQTMVAGVPGVLLEVGDVDDPVQLNGRTTYVITVTNQGFADSTNIRIACTLEENMQYVSSSGATAGTVEGNTITFAPVVSLAPKTKATWNVVVTAVKAGDVRFKVIMNTDQLTRPVEETEATRIYD